MGYSSLKLYKNIQFQKDYANVLLFNNITQQNNYFANDVTIHSEYNDFLYIEESKTIVVDEIKGDLLGVNYISFINADADKTYYAFIDRIEYSSSGSSTIYYTIDIMQTYMFDYKLAKSLVERGHIDRWIDDKYFLETDEPTLCEQSYDKRLHNRFLFGIQDICFIVFCVTETRNIFDIERNNQSVPNLLTFAIPIDLNTPNRRFYTEYGGSTSVIASWYEVLGNADLSPYISYAYIAQTLPISTLTVIDNTVSGVNTYDLIGGGDRYLVVLDLNTTDMANNYAPIISTKNYTKKELFFDTDNIVTNKDASFLQSIKNEIKCHSNPFKFVEFTIHNEKLALEPQKLNDSFNAKLFSYFTTPFSEGFYLDGYNNMDEPTSRMTCVKTLNEENTVPIKKDSWANWIANNGISTAFNLVSSAITSRKQVDKKEKFNARGFIGNAVSSAGEALQSVFVPDEVSNVTNTSLFTTLFYDKYLYTYIFELHNIGLYYELFHNYGYALNTNVELNIRSRWWFNYVRTAKANLTNIKDMTNDTVEKIKAVFNNGVTFWHYNLGTYKWLDYDCNNIERSIAT